MQLCAGGTPAQDRKEKMQSNNWEQVEKLGEGGQGTVFKVYRTPRDTMEFTHRLRSAINKTRESTSTGEDELQGALELVRLLRTEFAQGPLALKVLHDVDKARDATNARARMRREIKIMREVAHPSLLRIVDASDDEDELWYVSEFYEHGTLEDIRSRFTGNVQASLAALRPVVDAIAILHERGIVHRDIKPKNIFVKACGQLVLGDFGLALPFKDSEVTRLTDKYENVGTWEWMPYWAQGHRVSEVRPTFDVYALAKVFWWMVSGNRIFSLWHFDDEENDLTRLYAESPEMGLVNGLLKRCIVEKCDDCEIQTARDLLHELDALAKAIHTYQMLRNLRLEDLWCSCQSCGGTGFRPGSTSGNWSRCEQCDGRRGKSTEVGQVIAKFVDKLTEAKTPVSM